MSKIIKASSLRHVEKYNITEFSSVKRGESHFDLEHFASDAVSVQDEAMNPTAKMKDAGRFFVAASRKGATPGRVDTPSAPRLFSFYEEEDVQAAGQAFSPLYDAREPNERKERYDDRQVADQGDGAGFREVAYHETSLVHVPDSQKVIAEKNTEIALFEKEVQELKNDLAEMTKQRDELQNQVNSIPGLKSAAHAEGYNAAKKDFENEKKVEYEAQKHDYMEKMEKNWQVAVNEIKKINETLSELDKDMPQIVMSYVRQLIGAERRLNDAIIVNVVREALAHLKDIQQIIFTVNPDDAKILADQFPQYGISIDPSIPKGSVKVRTKIGEINLSVDSWMDSLEQQINEQLAISQNNQTK